MNIRITHPQYDGQLKLIADASGLATTIYLDGRAMLDLLGDRLAGTWDDLSIDMLRAQGFRVEIVSTSAINTRIALFCRLYKEYKGLAYKVSPADAGKMRHVAVDEALLRHYFTSDNWLFKGKHSVSNMVRYYNELRADMANPSNSRWPNTYDREYERKLDGAGITAYRAHLKALGMVPKRDKTGSIIDFTRP